jgi:hypothetical protein
MELYYEITENGYHIYDKNDSLFHVHQYEPYIPNKNLSYEENAIAQIAELMTVAEPVNEQEVIDSIMKEVSQHEY